MKYLKNTFLNDKGKLNDNAFITALIILAATGLFLDIFLSFGLERLINVNSDYTVLIAMVWVALPVGFLLAWAHMSIITKRLNDTKLNSNLWVLCFVPYVKYVFYIMLMFMPSKIMKETLTERAN